MPIQNAPKGSIVLKVIIVLLIGLLIYTIWEPFEVLRKEELNRTESRLRMLNLRNAQVEFHKRYDTYLSDVDSLIRWIKTDSLMVTHSDSLFIVLTDGGFTPDSLRHSPRTHREYRILVDDTSRTKRYLIEDPDGYGYVGSLEDLTLLHRGSWEY